MQIILSDQEIETVYEALLIAIQELEKERILDERRGRDCKVINSYIKRTSDLFDRIKPYHRL
jgi:hypothetical protein